jgi:hypothetical protein
MKLFDALIFASLLSGIAFFSGCANEAAPEAAATIVPIEDLKTVAGKWQGMVERLGQRDWAQMIIHDDGTYLLRSYRGIGVYNGQGVFTLVDGKLTVQSEKGKATYVLYQKHGQDVLSLTGSLNGLDYTGNFSRENK